MKKLTLFASLLALFSFMLISVEAAHAHPGFAGIALDDCEEGDDDALSSTLEEDDCDGDELRGQLDDCEDDDERKALDDCDDDTERAALDCSGEEDDCDGEE